MSAAVFFPKRVASIRIQRDNRQLFNDVPIEMLSLDFLTGDEVKRYSIKVRQNNRGVSRWESSVGGVTK